MKRIWSLQTNRVVVKNQFLFTSLHFTLSTQHLQMDLLLLCAVVSCVMVTCNKSCNKKSKPVLMRRLQMPVIMMMVAVR